MAVFHIPCPSPLPCGLPQGFSLPSFSVFISNHCRSEIIHRYGILHHQYADGTCVFRPQAGQMRLLRFCPSAWSLYKFGWVGITSDSFLPDGFPSHCLDLEQLPRLNISPKIVTNITKRITIEISKIILKALKTVKNTICEKASFVFLEI